MGRLDDHAKKRIVELRKAGLSFRKIKKVLELDGIRVTPQAIYLFLKRKNVEPAPLPPSSQPPPALEKAAGSPVTDRAGWEEDKLWSLLQENGGGPSQQREPGGLRAPCPALGAGPTRDGPPLEAGGDGIKIVSVTSLSRDGGQFAKQNVPHGGLSVGPHLGPNVGNNCPPPQQASASTGCAAPVAPAFLPHNLNSKGKTFLPPARNPALIVKRKIIGRAIHLQKKANVQNGHTQPSSSPAPPFMLRMQPAGNSSRQTPPAPATPLSYSRHTKEASTQTSSSNPVCSAASPASPWGGQMVVPLVPAAGPQSLADKLDAVHAEVQKLAHALQAVLERQGRLERQQEQQQRTQQEVLMALQQLSATVSQEVVPGSQPCPPYGSLVDPSPSLPSFSQFKMELI